MSNWRLESGSLQVWAVRPEEGGFPPVMPRFQGGFGDEITPPGDIRVTCRRWGAGGASMRFRAVRGPEGPFGVSVEVDPLAWTPAGSRRGWHLFRCGDFPMALWSSLPASWLAQDPAGKPLPPPWRELWTFGSDHIWAVLIPGPAEGAAAGLFEHLPDVPPRPRRRGGVLMPGNRIGMEAQS